MQSARRPRVHVRSRSFHHDFLRSHVLMPLCMPVLTRRLEREKSTGFTQRWKKRKRVTKQTKTDFFTSSHISHTLTSTAATCTFSDDDEARAYSSQVMALYPSRHSAD